MKKVNYRSIFMVLLVAASLASYTFLSSVQTNILKETKAEIESVEVKEPSSKLFMPDVELMKKVLEISKAVFHPFSD